MTLVFSGLFPSRILTPLSLAAIAVAKGFFPRPLNCVISEAIPPLPVGSV